jgi:hypothetical protein
MNCATHSDTAAVAFCRTCGKPLCNQCTRDVRGVIYCEACLAARMEGAASAPAAGFVPPAQTVYPPVGDASTAYRPPINAGPNPTVAGILGAIPLGLGAVYCGQYAKGLAHLGIFVGAIIALSSDLSWQANTVLGIFLGFFWVYQILDAIRTAKAIQANEPVPDPFGLTSAFGTGEKLETTKVPAAAAILIGLGVLFLLHTAGLFSIDVVHFVSLILIVLGVWLFAKHWGLLGTHHPTCVCERCKTSKLMGPAVLVTLGVVFLIGFFKAWPAILLVIGAVKLMQSNASTIGHIGPLPPGTPQGIPSGLSQSVPPPPAPQNPEPPTSSGEVKNV